MVLKAGPQGFWHCQPDNGTFELWHRGRNFFPDSGSYVYGGDSAVLAQRNWFRQTQVHNTLTLDGRNLEHTDSKCLRWETDDATHIVTVGNPLLRGPHPPPHGVVRRPAVLRHRGCGHGRGCGTRRPALQPRGMPARRGGFRRGRVATRFEDGNNLVLQVFGRRASPGGVGFARLPFAQPPSGPTPSRRRSGPAGRYVSSPSCSPPSTPPRRKSRPNVAAAPSV